MIPACALAALLVIAATYLTWLLTERRAYNGRHEFQDPDDATDPDGTRFIAELHHEDLPAAGRLAMLPPARLDDTMPIPHAVGTWGMPADQLLDELARTHMEVTR